MENDIPRAAATEPAEAKPRPAQFRREKRDVNGWLILDKPVGMTSTHAVAVVKRVFAAKKAGHAGTLDPLASGRAADRARRGDQDRVVRDGRPQGLPVHRALGHRDRHRRCRGPPGRGLRRSRPDEAAIRAMLPRFTGVLMQTPPKYSAIKIAGERAYDLAREGEEVLLEPRPVEIDRLDLIAILDAEHAEFEAECGKGTYVRALARDFGRALGTCGHVSALRRTMVGPFAAQNATTLDALQGAGQVVDGTAGAAAFLLPVEAGVQDLHALSVSRAGCRAARARATGAAARARCARSSKAGSRSRPTGR